MARTRIQTLSRRNLVLTVLALLLGAWIFLRPSAVRGVARGDLPAAFASFNRTDVRQIEIEQTHPTEPGKTDRMVLKRTSGDAWELPERFGVAALPGSAARLIDGVIDARERSSVTRRAATFDRYRTGEGWRDVRLRDGQGKELVAFSIGRTDRAELFVKRGEGTDAEIIRTVNLRPAAFSTDVVDWVDRQLWPSDLKSKDVVRIDLVRAGSPAPITVVKRGTSGEAVEGVTVPDLDPDQKDLTWWVASPPPPGDADALEVEDLVRAATGILINDVVHGAQGDEARFGLDAPTLRLTLWQDLGAGAYRRHELLVGGRDDNDHAYARRVGGDHTVTVPSAGSLARIDVSADELRRAPDPGGDDTDQGSGGD